MAKLRIRLLSLGKVSLGLAIVAMLATVGYVFLVFFGCLASAA
jgi:hypothetical protein